MLLVHSANPRYDYQPLPSLSSPHRLVSHPAIVETLLRDSLQLYLEQLESHPLNFGFGIFTQAQKIVANRYHAHEPPHPDLVISIMLSGDGRHLRPWADADRIVVYFGNVFVGAERSERWWISSGQTLVK